MPKPPTFAKPRAAAAANNKQPPKSRWAGTKAGTPRDPMPHPGMYRFRVLEAAEGYNPGTGKQSQKIKLEIVHIFEQNEEIHAVGDVVSAIFMATPAGMGETKNLIMAAAGFAEEEAFDAYDGEASGQAIAAALGIDNEYSQGGFTIVGRLVDGQVIRGRDTPNKDDFYRIYHWGVVGEDEQDQTPAGWLS